MCVPVALLLVLVLCAVLLDMNKLKSSDEAYRLGLQHGAEHVEAKVGTFREVAAKMAAHR